MHKLASSLLAVLALGTSLLPGSVRAQSATPPPRNANPPVLVSRPSMAVRGAFEAASRLKPGDRVRVQAVSAEAVTVKTERGTIVAIPAQRPMNLQHGYATTIHSCLLYTSPSPRD